MSVDRTAQLEDENAALRRRLKVACDALLLLSITGSSELPAVSWDDLEAPVPATVDDLREVIERRKKEAFAAWEKATKDFQP